MGGSWSVHYTRVLLVNNMLFQKNKGFAFGQHKPVNLSLGMPAQLLGMSGHCPSPSPTLGYRDPPNSHSENLQLASVLPKKRETTPPLLKCSPSPTELPISQTPCFFLLLSYPLDVISNLGWGALPDKLTSTLLRTCSLLGCLICQPISS